MSISDLRDPRDSLPAILRPGDNVYAVDETAYIQRETGIDGLRVWFNIPRRMFVIEDSRAPGGPSASFVMRVQNPDGTPRDIDMRTVVTLRKHFGAHKATAQELIDGELERDRANKARRAGYGEQIADTLKFFGQVITPSVAWSARSAAREAIGRVKKN